MHNATLTLSYLANDLLVVDDEQAAVGNALSLPQDTVVLGYLHVLVGKEWDIKVSKTSLLARGVSPADKSN